jgi:hypothetical protein
MCYLVLFLLWNEMVFFISLFLLFTRNRIIIKKKCNCFSKVHSKTIAIKIQVSFENNGIFQLKMFVISKKKCFFSFKLNVLRYVHSIHLLMKKILCFVRTRTFQCGTSEFKNVICQFLGSESLFSLFWPLKV